LLKEIEGCFLSRLGPGRLPKPNPEGPRRIRGLVCPHAGYVYSGPVAAASYAALAEDGAPGAVVIMGPNHTGRGSGVSIMTEGEWETPLGRVAVDTRLAEKILTSSSIIDVDEEAHRYEHSLEVQIPFLQYLYQDRARIVPICLMMQDLETSVEVGEAVARAAGQADTVIIASTDMSHYEPQEEAQKKDSKAIEAILSLQEERLHTVIRSENVTMCGYGPVTALMRAARLCGFGQAELLSYRTSGDVTGDYGAVVGYASIKFSKQ
ncbi:MAG: AmmeMemoRadiSam system protein B, partial [Candidatus Bathyarchaeia archaeon]